MNLGDVGLNVSYQIDLVGRLRRAAEAANADAQASQAALDLAKVSVAADVARAYVDACSAGRELAVAETAAGLQDKALAASVRLAAAGRGSQLDITRGRGLTDQARAVIPGFEARRRAALYRLAVLTGQPPAAFPRELDDCASPPRLSRPIPAAMAQPLCAAGPTCARRSGAWPEPRRDRRGHGRPLSQRQPRPRGRLDGLCPTSVQRPPTAGAPAR